MRELNRRFPADDENMQYFTMIYGILDARDGKVTFTQAGQPAPIHMTKGTSPRLVGGGGLPVGLSPMRPTMNMNSFCKPEERIILYSDGITGCTNQDGQEISTERLMDRLQQWQDLSLRSLMERWEGTLREWQGCDELEDDMSLLAMERNMT